MYSPVVRRDPIHELCKTQMPPKRPQGGGEVVKEKEEEKERVKPDPNGPLAWPKQKIKGPPVDPEPLQPLSIRATFKSSISRGLFLDLGVRLE
jgi:hypothetical protein